MKPVLLGALVLGGLVLAGCQSTKNPYDPPKPLDQMNKDELCSYYAFFLTNPNLLEETRKTATTKMRQKGCTT